MPELPEVERGRRIAEAILVGNTIAKVRTVQDDIVYTDVTPRRFASRLKGRSVIAARRWGKYLWLELDRRPWPIFHFGMTGSFQAYDDPADRPRFWKVEIETESGRFLAMPNARRLGRIRLQDDPEAESPIKDLGFDPLLNLPSPKAFSEILRKRKAPLKAILLDQKFAAGVGNWIADEILYQAKIAPHRRGHELTEDELRRVRLKMRLVINKAVAVNSSKHEFPKSWLFHYRWRKPENAKTAKGESIEFANFGGRTTAWVPAVQV